MLKKLILSLLMISASSALADNDENKPFINISQRQAKDFFAGFFIGAVHGATNQFLEYKLYEKKDEVKGGRAVSIDDKNLLSAYAGATFLITDKIESKYNGSDRTNWGIIVGPPNWPMFS